MINIKTLPKDTAAELLRYISEHEDFNSVDELAARDLTVQELKALLREIANQLEREALAEATDKYDVKGCKVLTKSSKGVIGCLSPSEEKKLLVKFGLIEKK